MYIDDDDDGRQGGLLFSKKIYMKNGMPCSYCFLPYGNRSLKND